MSGGSTVGRNGAVVTEYFFRRAIISRIMIILAFLMAIESQDGS